MEPIDLFHRIFHVHIYRFQILCGSGILSAGFRPHKWTFFWSMLNASYFVCSIYTLAVYETNTQWKCLTCVGIAIQGLIKFSAILYHAPTIFDMVEFLHMVYAVNADAKSANYKTLLKYSKIAMFIVIAGAAVICTTCALFVPMTFVDMFNTGKRVPLLQAFMPFVDETSTVGYMVLFFYHLIILFLAGCGSSAADLLLITFVIYMWPLSGILENMMRDLNDAVRVAPYRESPNVKRFLRNIILVHKEYCRFLRGISDIFCYIIFCEIYTCAMSLCVTIFCLLTMDWFELYFMFMLMFSKLLVYCSLGTIVVMTSDRVLAALLASNWYLLPLNEQRHFLLMLATAQNPTTLRAGNLPLNLDTFVNVMKSVYSVGMILIESVGE